MSPPRTPSISRREAVKRAVALGGATALSACLSIEGDSGESPSFLQGPSDPSAVPNRQHAWSDYLVRDAHGNTVLPEHQLLLFFDLVSDEPPTPSDRDRIETALRTLDRAYQRGTGGDVGASINEGLLFTLGYSRRYFDRFEAALPSSLDLQRPETVLEAVGEDPGKADNYDALLVLSADFGSILLATEAALFGEADTLNGIQVDANFAGIFERRERRTGFAGKGLPAERLEDERIPPTAPLSMGFKSGFRDSLPSEDLVTIPSGPFADGTTQQASRLEIDIGRWYDANSETRVDRMFSPGVGSDEVGATAEGLGNDSGVTEEMVSTMDETAAESGRFGHAAKTARARNDAFEPVILRRSEGVATDVDAEGVAGFNFTSVQRTIEDFVATRQAMNPEEYDVDVPAADHGIIDFLETRSRATYLIPPRSARALPTPTGEANG